MGTVAVSEQAPTLFGGSLDTLTRDIEDLRLKQLQQRELEGSILRTLEGDGLNDYERALANTCVGQVHGQIGVLRSPAVVQITLDAFEAAVADPGDVVLHVRKPPCYDTDRLFGPTERVITQGDQIRVLVGGNTSVPAQQIHDGFFTAQEITGPRRFIHDSLLVGREPVQGFLKLLNSETTDKSIQAGGTVHEIADIHGELLRHGIDPAELDSDFLKFIKDRQEQVRELGETLLKGSFEASVRSKSSVDGMTRDDIQARLLGRTIDAVRVLGVTSDVATKVMDSVPCSQKKLQQRHEDVREKVLVALG